MFKRLYRQRRRIVLFTALFALSMVIFAVGNPEVRYVIKHQAAGNETLFYSVAIVLITVLPALFASLVVLLFPSLRQALEAVGVTLVVQSLIERALSRYEAWEYFDLAMWGSFFVLYFVVMSALQQNWFRGAGLTKSYVARSERTLNAAPPAIWAATAPTAETTGSYWTGGLIKAEPRPEWGPDAHEVHFRLGQFGTLVQRHDRSNWDQPHGFEYAYGPVDDAPARQNASGTYKVRIEALADGRSLLSLDHHIVDLGFGTWSLLWLDDTARCEIDAVQARLHGRRDWSIAGWSARKMAAV